MAQGILTSDFRPEYSENLLPIKSLFNENIAVNLTSGMASFAFSDEYNFTSGKSLYCFMESYKTTDIAFNFGNELLTTIKNQGNHIFSFRMLNANTTFEFFPSFVIYVKVWVNGINTNDFECHMVSDVDTYSKKWVAFAQSMSFNETDEVNFSFYIDADLSYPFNNLGFYIDGLKLEYDDRFLGTPSIYSRPSLPESLTETGTGWQELEDSLHTVGSPQSISAGVTANLTNDGVTANRITQLPSDTTSFFDISTTKLTPTNEGDYYTVDFMFKVKNSVQSGWFDVWVDIGGIGERFRQTRICPKTANTETNINITFGHFTSSQFALNGGVIKIKAESGDLSVYDKQFRISRTHKAR